MICPAAIAPGATARKTAVSPVRTAPTGPFDQTTVLVVDDSRAQRAILRGNLKRWGFSVREAGTGLEALEICRSEPVDLVLCDWMMPEMDGLAFCTAFRAMNRERYGYFILIAVMVSLTTGLGISSC